MKNYFDKTDHVANQIILFVAYNSIKIKGEISQRYIKKLSLLLPRQFLSLPFLKRKQAYVR